jgi:hypothetical protein
VVLVELVPVVVVVVAGVDVVAGLLAAVVRDELDEVVVVFRLVELELVVLLVVLLDVLLVGG